VATVELDPQNADRVTVVSTYTELHLVEQIPGVRHDRKRSIHTAPKTWSTWMALQGIFTEWPLAIGPQYQGWLQFDFQHRVQPCLALRSSTNVLQDPNTPWDDKLFAFQRAGAAFMALAKQALLADEMGAGKTVTTISAVRRLHAYGADVFPVLCIVPNSTKRPWKREWDKWFPGLSVSVVGGGAQERAKALRPGFDVYVINWEAVQLHSRVAGHGNIRLVKCAQCDKNAGDPNLKISRCQTHEKELNHLDFHTVIIDEAHFMKNPEAIRTRAVWAVLRAKSVEYCYALTGTAIADTPDDLWPIMHGLRPLEYPTVDSYRSRYCLQSWDWEGNLVIVGINPNTRAEFFGFFDTRFRRMPKALVLPYLPPMMYEERDCPMSPKQAKAYKDMEKLLMADLDGEVLIAHGNLPKNTRLLQFASATCEYDPVTDEVTMTMPSPKITELLRVIEEAASPLVVCAESRKLLELASRELEKLKISHEMLVGGMTDDQRDAVIMNFDSGRSRILMFTKKTGGTGLNMTAADKMVRLDRSWSMLVEYQVMNRIHRIGSEKHKSITVIDLVAPGTKEERQFEVLGAKMARLEEINRDKMTLAAAGRHAEVQILEREEHAIVNSTLLA
jgi:SNF2 family DNA or RNA helicase